MLPLAAPGYQDRSPTTSTTCSTSMGSCSSRTSSITPSLSYRQAWMPRPPLPSRRCPTRATPRISMYIVYSLLKTMSVAWGKNAVTPVCSHWSHCSLVLNHWYHNANFFITSIADCRYEKLTCPLMHKTSYYVSNWFELAQIKFINRDAVSQHWLQYGRPLH